MPTIVDRCQRFDFQRPSLEQIAEVIRRVSAAEEIEISDGAIGAIARSAAGSFRDALGTLDQLVSYGGKEVSTDDVLAVLGVAEADLILAAADAIAAGDGRAALEISERLAGSGRDVTQFARDLLGHLRQLIVIKTIGEAPESFAVTAAEPERLRTQAESFTELALGRSVDVLSKALADVREGDEPRMTVELALLRCARPSLDASREAMAERLERVEAALRGGPGPGVAASNPPPATPDPVPSVEPAGPPAQPDPRADAATDEQDTEDNGTATAAVEMDLEKLVGLWPAVLDQVRESGSGLLSQILSAARPVAVNTEEAVLEVGFPASAAFNKRKAEANDARDRFSEAVKTIVGERLRPVFVLLETEEAKPQAEQQLSEDELIELMRAEFDAEEYLPEPDAGEDEAQAKEA